LTIQTLCKAQQHPLVLAKAAIIILVLKKASLISLKTKIFNARHQRWHSCQKPTNPHYHPCPVSALMHWL
jgi:hypothetical protein